MKTYTQEELNEVLKQHNLWLQGNNKGQRADLSGVNLSGADLSMEEWEKLKPFFQIVTEDTKYVYKKLQNNIIAYLMIPEKAKRSNAFSRKCRAEYVKVLNLVDENGKEVNEGYSQYSGGFKYQKGKIVRPDSFDENWWNECGNGIHFFLTIEEAKQFIL